MLWCSMFCYCYHFDVTTLMFHVLLLLRCSMLSSFAVPCFPALMLHPPNAILLCISSTLRGIQECLQMCERFLSTMDTIESRCHTSWCLQVMPRGRGASSWRRIEKEGRRWSSDFFKERKRHPEKKISWKMFARQKCRLVEKEMLGAPPTMSRFILYVFHDGKRQITQNWLHSAYSERRTKIIITGLWMCITKIIVFRLLSVGEPRSIEKIVPPKSHFRLLANNWQRCL